MANQYTEEELHLAIGKSIISNSALTFDELVTQLFGSDLRDVTTSLCSCIRKDFLRQNKALCRFNIKNELIEQLKSGSSNFIRKFIALRKEDRITEIFSEELRSRLAVLQGEDAIGSLLAECRRLFDQLREKFAPAEKEHRFRNFLAQWLQSGFMSRSMWEAWFDWNRKGVTLKSLKNIDWPAGAKNDSNLRTILKMINEIKTDNFVEMEKLKIILNIFLIKPVLKVDGSRVKLTGRSVYLSEWAENIENAVTANNAVQIEIFAEDCCGIDCDLVGEMWQGINLVIVSNKVFVWQDARIRLSGDGYKPGKTKAASAPSTQYRGADGEDGRPGESSGNFAILATEMHNASKLTVELSGGRGEDGQDGGDGYNGKNGVGVTKADLDNLVVSYNSLYRDSWSNFHNYSPPSNWTKTDGNSSSGEYIHRKYKDEGGRIMTYSFAGDKGWTYTTYELYFILEGSDGTSATMGGSNGVGGEGGYNGTCTVMDPETGKEFKITVVKGGNQNGVDGIEGKSGIHGVNGNDMALIDRSAKEASKHYEGSSDRKLAWSYVYKAKYKSRLNGYRRYEQKEDACFIEFGQGEKIDTSERRATKAQQRTTRTSASVAVAKQAIVVSEVVAEAKALFGANKVFLDDACEATADAAVDEVEVEEEEEVEENVNEEVVVLRQKEEVSKLAKYTPESEKKTRLALTPEAYVNHVKCTGQRTTVNTRAQILFDLFTLEIPPPLLNTIAMPILRYQINYRIANQASHVLAFVAATQMKLVGGKSFKEIKEFGLTLAARRKRKFATSRFRQKLANLTAKVDAVEVRPSMEVSAGAMIQFGIKKDNLSEKLVPFTSSEEVRKVVQGFYSKYVENSFAYEVLVALNDYLKGVKEQYRQQLELIASTVKFEWTDKNAMVVYIDDLKSRYNGSEQQATEETKAKEESAQHDPTSHKVPSSPSLTIAEETFHKAAAADYEYWRKLVKPINKIIKGSAELTARFGAPPDFEKDGYLDAAKNKMASIKNVFSSSTTPSKDNLKIEQTVHLMKMYGLARSILVFNKRLYKLNAIMLAETGSFGEDLPDDDEKNFDSYLAQLQRRPVPQDTDQCEMNMRRLGLASGAFRYLLALHLHVRLCAYRKVSFTTLQKVEDYNSTTKKFEMVWLQEDDSVTGIAPDEGVRYLFAAQDAAVKEHQVEFKTELTAYPKIDYSQDAGRRSLASFFPQPLQKAVIEWTENFFAITRDQTLLQILQNRFYVDGCHLSVFEFQFVLISWASLQQMFHCQTSYLQLLANSVPQSELVHAFLYTRIEYHLGARLKPSSKIFTGIQMIPNARYKALLATKLSEYKSIVNVDDLYKIILMLQHASNGSEQLAKIGLEEWIEIAQKQKWSEIGYLLKQYGSIGYYLGVLDSKSMKIAEEGMRAIFDDVTIIPEKVIALCTNLIVNGDIAFNDQAFEHLKQLLIRAKEYPELADKVTKHQLVTNEAEQAKLINWMVTGKISSSQVSLDKLVPSTERNVDVLMEKITGLHDAPEDVDKRRENIRKIGWLLKSNDSSSQNIVWLNKFDDALFRLKKKRLRDTQKMAILCAVDGKRVLEQVNTGEGKSFIIAAIAVIRRKTGRRFVDVITSSPVLAQRDAAEMADLYGALGLHVADNCSEDLETRKKAYSADIVYGDMAHFQRDYLLHTFYKKPIMGDRTRVAVIVDEVDNMLLDNGNNMLYLSHNVPGMNLLDSLLIFIQQQINEPLYTGDKCNIEQMQAQYDNAVIKRSILADLFGSFSLADLTVLDSGHHTAAHISDIYNKLIENDIIDPDGYLKIHRRNQLSKIETALKVVDAALVLRIQACFGVILAREKRIELPPYLRFFAKSHLDELIENCKHALFLAANTGYVVDVDRTGKMTTALEPIVTIIDSNPGADLATSQWSGGLHQFLQLKHGCRLSPMSLKAVFVSNVAYLRGYDFINGLSGTLGSAEESKTLIELYDADLIKIPTNKPKLFYEHVPVIATERKEWIQNIYDEICDQADGMRSVLLICEDIMQLETVLSGLKVCFEAEERPSVNVRDCFKNIAVYKREHDEFDFEDEHKLEPHRLIIATNLAGRGTDIKLSDAVVKAGGLHVITAFMPKNCRIEEQAFGRAARCGQPGSAQIITFIEKSDDTIQPSVFQLKMFRDNAEVHRLQSLKSFYDFHTEIEESCLEKFRSYCDQALSAMTSAKDSEELATPSQVVYFALLDQWALWLDDKAPQIKQCAKERNTHAKEALIKSVDDFLGDHPFGNQNNCFEVAKQWIDAPQSLLTIGIIQMHHNGGFTAAEETFDRILADGPEFAPEAHYYKACMRMKNFEQTRESLSSLKLSEKHSFDENIEEAIAHFYKSRTMFLHRLNRKQMEASIVARLVEKAPSNNPKTSGFAAQHKSLATYTQLIINNIDYLLGAPCKPQMFAEDKITEEYSKTIYEAFCRQGLISPPLIANHKVEDWQLEPIRRKYKLQRKQLNVLIKVMSSDPCALSFGNYSVLSKPLILQHCPLSTRSQFWADLDLQKALYDSETLLVVADKTQLSDKLLKTLNQLEPYLPPNTEQSQTLVRYSAENDIGTMYRMKAVEDIVGGDSVLTDEITKAFNNDSLKLDKIAKVVIAPNAMSYFSEFDGVTTEDVREFFGISAQEAGWILSQLKEQGVLELQTVKMVRCAVDEEVWKKKVRVHLKKEAEKPKESDPAGLKLLFKHAGELQQIRDNSKLMNVTEGVVAYFCRLPFEESEETDESNNKETVGKKAKTPSESSILYNYLIEQHILEPYLYNVYRLASKLDCSGLPSCIANEIDEFLADRFAYTFALENLCTSLEASHSNPTASPHKIFLPENPFAEVFDDFVACGLAMPPRLCSDTDDLDLIEYDDFKHADTIKSVVMSNRLKLYDQTDYHMEVHSFAAYVKDQGFAIDSDLQAIMDNGLKVIVGKKKEKTSRWLLNQVVKAAAWCWNKACAVGRKIANVGYSIVKFAVHLPGKIFSKVADYAAPYVKQVGEFIASIAKPLLDTKLGRIATVAANAAKEAVVELGYKALEAAEWVVDQGGRAVNAVSKAATSAVKWVAESELGKGVAALGKDIGSWITSTELWKKAAETATYVYTKMHGFCTAVSESYHYYNQCRTAARRIAIEKGGMMHEHAILKMFNGIATEEAKKEAVDVAAEEKIQKHIASHRPLLVSSLTSYLQSKLKIHENCNYPPSVVKTVLQRGAGVRKLSAELESLLFIYSWMEQLKCYNSIESISANDVSLANIAFKPPESIGKNLLFMIETSIDQIFEELNQFEEDDGYQSDGSRFTDIPESVFTEAIKNNDWKVAVKEILTSVIEKAIDTDFVDKTTSIILGYYSSLRGTNNLPPSESQSEFNSSDKHLKEALDEYNIANRSKRQAQFLATELHTLIHNILDDKSTNSAVLKTALKYGYPLPLSVAKEVALRIDRYLENTGKYKSGILLQVSDDQNEGKVIIEHKIGEGKAKMQMRHVNGHLFLCQADYHAYAGMGKQTTEEVDKAFFYEALVGYMKTLRGKFPKQGETLREGLLAEM